MAVVFSDKIYKYNHFKKNNLYQGRCLIKRVGENLRMDFDILKNVRFRDQFFRKHQLLASLTLPVYLTYLWD